MRKGECPNSGCYFSAEPYGMYMCEECVKGQTVNMTDDDLCELFFDAIEEFKNNRFFREQIRSVDGDMSGEYVEDCETFEGKMFDIVNGILMTRVYE